MWRDAWFIARKDVGHSLRLPQVWVWMLVMPLLLSWIVGSVMQGIAGRIDRLAVYVPNDAGFLADDLLGRVRASGYRLVRVANRAELNAYPFHLDIPSDFTRRVLAEPPARIDLAYPGGYSLIGWEEFRVQRAARQLLADLAVLAHEGRPPTAANLAALEAEPRKLELREESAGPARKLILGYEQSVPGFIVTFTLMVSLTTGCVLMVSERRRGLLRRLAAVGVSRGSMAAGKLAARLVQGAIQIAIAMLAGKWLFGMDWGGPSIWGVLVLLAAWALFCSALALLFASRLRTENQALAAGVIATNLLAALGGCWWPLEVTPDRMQKAALLLPSGWTMHALHLVISYGRPPWEAMPYGAALLCGAALAGWLAARHFQVS